MAKNFMLFFSFLFIWAEIRASNLISEDIETTTHPKPLPYAFNYQAGRFPGHIDRVHSEVSDGSGTIEGTYSYIDPRNQIRTVTYVANEHGFYPSLSHPPQDTAAVTHAKNRHYALYSKIAQEHASSKLVPVNEEDARPRDTVAVTNAKLKHYGLYEKIAAEHARIAAEREAERLANPHLINNEDV